MVFAAVATPKHMKVHTLSISRGSLESIEHLGKNCYLISSGLPPIYGWGVKEGAGSASVATQGHMKVHTLSISRGSLESIQHLGNK
jgi:hypothetical protein